MGTLATSAVLLALGSHAAFADQVTNTIDSTPDTALEIRNVVAGTSSSVGFQILEGQTGGVTDPTGDRQGCNAAGNAPVTVNLSVPSGVMAGTTTLSFTDCGVVQNVNFAIPTSTIPGDYNVSVASVSGGKANSLFNSAPASFTLRVGAPAPTDTTPPSITPTVIGTAGANGWYTSDVTVSWLVVDNESAITSSSGCDAVTISTETTGQTLTCAATSAGGTTSKSVTIKLDKTGPSAALAVTAGDAGENGWYTSDVTVSTSGTDSISGPVTCTPDQTQTSETTGQEFNGSCTNDAGLTTNAAPLTVKLDKTGPSAALAVTAGDAGENGWYTSDVTVSTSGSDTISGPVTCTSDQTQTTETAGQVFNGSCTNDAGLTTNAAPLTVKLDKTGPSAALAVTAGDAGENGWYTSDVTVSTSGSDTISGPVTCTSDQTQTTETAGQVFNGSCTNDAGLSTNAASLTVKLDKTLPGVLWTGGPAAGGTYYFGFVPSPPTCSATDGLSGPADCAVSGYSAAVGGHTMTATAHDNAGNTGTDTRNYTVSAWTLKGFYQPVDMNGALNMVKAGSTVPLKFEVFAGSTELTDTAVVDTFKWGEVPCTDFSGAVQDDIEQYTSGQTVLRYDTTGGQFIQNWQTPKKAGSCYKVVMKTDDGSSISANFKLK
ncbi:PxKF domain-containing protein [Humibacillus xanthopallidus]|uniref:PxKF domain-containing protein n=1 Tax=Humibacillus xanthopallidus TaxID=412689 RepID=UPI00163B5437|nr:PxKF domain-containing protein [Humibacillus xanthopallidus]